VPEDWNVGANPSQEVLALARQMLAGEIAWREGKLEEAFAAMREGARLEDRMVYDEPPGWMQPVRHAFGALLVAAGRHAEAEEVYREDLRRNPGNGWSLLGLEQALAMMGKADEASEVAAELERNPGVTPLRRAQLGFFAALLGRFAAALRSGGGLEQLVPVEVGEVRSVERIKGARDLRLCRVAVFGAVLPIVTNLTETRKGALMKVARVPPVELMGVLSEGQFLGPAAAHEAAGSEPELTPRDAQEIRKSLGTLLES